MGGRRKSTPEKIARTGVGVTSTATRVAGIPAGSVVGPLSMLNGGVAALEAGDDMYRNGVGAGNVWDLTRGLGGVASGWAGLTGAVGSALQAGGGHAAGAGLGEALGASALGTVGAVAGAGLAGYGVGSLIADAAESDYGRSSVWGTDAYSGQAKTGYDWAGDKAVAADDAVADFTGNDTLGSVAGGATALTLGVVGGIGGGITAAGNWLFD